jgi:hypothetical protein
MEVCVRGEVQKGSAVMIQKEVIGVYAVYSNNRNL